MTTTPSFLGQKLKWGEIFNEKKTNGIFVVLW
jgi:hypothetical protein